ncbi:hypothetical protein NP284_30005 [Rhodopseudomonas pseudopalustris]|uniref:hypothetical protein n=1 Tax=Rhodopseudomonas pseudopalustris TaxID=1513892 RepID=UPI003F9EAA99
MTTAATDQPLAVDAPTGRLICATIATRLRDELDDVPLPLQLAVLLERMQRHDGEPR